MDKKVVALSWVLGGTNISPQISISLFAGRSCSCSRALALCLFVCYFSALFSVTCSSFVSALSITRSLCVFTLIVALLCNIYIFVSTHTQINIMITFGSWPILKPLWIGSRSALDTQPSADFRPWVGQELWVPLEWKDPTPTSPPISLHLTSPMSNIQASTTTWATQSPTKQSLLPSSWESPLHPEASPTSSSKIFDMQQLTKQLGSAPWTKSAWSPLPSGFVTSTSSPSSPYEATSTLDKHFTHMWHFQNRHSYCTSNIDTTCPRCLRRLP